MPPLKRPSCLFVSWQNFLYTLQICLIGLKINHNFSYNCIKHTSRSIFLESSFDTKYWRMNDKLMFITVPLSPMKEKRHTREIILFSQRLLLVVAVADHWLNVKPPTQAFHTPHRPPPPTHPPPPSLPQSEKFKVNVHRKSCFVLRIVCFPMMVEGGSLAVEILALKIFLHTLCS